MWRGASLCLPPKCRIAAEKSRDVKKEVVIAGELDFWVDGVLEWGIELLRRGQRKGEHIKRFLRNGTYAKFAPKKARVVDFRPFPSRPRGNPQNYAENYVAVVVDKDFSGATVISSSQEARVKFLGKLDVTVYEQKLDKEAKEGKPPVAAHGGDMMDEISVSDDEYEHDEEDQELEGVCKCRPKCLCIQCGCRPVTLDADGRPTIRDDGKKVRKACPANCRADHHSLLSDE